jgi:hypothetical protein
MSYWFKDRPFTPNQEVLDRIRRGSAAEGIRRHNRRVQEIKELQELGIAEVGELSKRDLWMLGVGLYMGEGAKTTEAIRVVNSDPAVIRLAIRWFKEVCGLTDENLTVSLHIYPDNDEYSCKEYWQHITKLPSESFRWVSVDRRANKRIGAKGRLPYGTAHITVRANGNAQNGVKLFRRIKGWMTGVFNQV